MAAPGRIVTVAQQKGGSGKTTLAAGLAIAARGRGLSVALIDTDPQGSLGRWFMTRRERLGEGAIEFTTSSAWGVSYECEKLRRQADLILIDTPPSLGLTTQAALHAADMIVLPCTPAKHAIFGLPDVVSVAATVSDAPHKVLITLADNRTRADSLGRKHLLAKFDVIGEVPKFSRISDNISSRRYPMGRVDPEYAAEIEALFMRIYDTAAALKKKGR